MSRAALGLLFLGMMVASCGDEPAIELSVDLRTDYVPGVEFTGVRVTLVGEDATEESLAGSGSYVRGERVAEFTGLSGSERRAIAVELIRPDGATLARREVVVLHDTSLAVTVVLSRDCRNVTCPLAGDSAAVSCLGGRCVDPECLEGDEEACLEPECTVDTDCVSMAACAVPSCQSGVCLYEAGGGCGGGEYCDPERGCVPLDPEPDTCSPTLDVTTTLLEGDTTQMGIDGRLRDPALAFDGDGAWLALTTEYDNGELFGLESQVHVMHLGCDGTLGASSLAQDGGDTPRIGLAEGQVLVACRPIGGGGDDCFARFDAADGGALSADRPDPGFIGAIVPRSGGFHLVYAERLEHPDQVVRVWPLDATGAPAGAPFTPLDETTFEQEMPTGAPTATEPVVSFLRTGDMGRLGIADEVVVWTPWSGTQPLDAPSPKSGRSAPVVVMGETAWVAVHEGPNRSEENLVSLHRVDADGAQLRPELAPPPTGASDSLLAFVGAAPGELALVVQREHEDGGPLEVLVRRIAITGDAVTVGEPTLLPGIERGVLGRMAAAHVGGGVLMLVWAEPIDGPSGAYASALRLRFVQL